MQSNITKLAMLFGIVATMGFGTMNTAVADTSERTGGLGHIELVLADEAGNIKQYVQTDNFITHEGLDCLVDVLFGSSTTGTCGATTTFDAVGLGTGSAATVASTALSSGLASGCLGFTDLTPSSDGGTGTQTITINAIFGGACSSGADVTASQCEATITEAGLFNAGGAAVALGDMFAYQTFTGITIATADTLTVTWALDFT